MKTKKNLLATLLTLSLLAATPEALTGCNRHSEGEHGSITQTAAKKEVWVCPMHPQVRQDKPGQCPICKMDLVKEETPAAPVEPVASAPNPDPSAHGAPDGQPAATNSAPAGGSPDGHAKFQLSLDRQQMIGVRTGVVTARPLFKEIRAPGRVAFDPELYTAQTEYREALEQLARVRSSPLADARHSAERMVESAKLRLKILGLSDAQINALGSGQRKAPDLLLNQPGEDVWVYAEVFEMDLPNVTPGLEATLTASFLAGKSLTGKVVSVDRVLNPATRTAKVRISVPKARLTLRPETYVDVAILAPLGKQIAVPFDAVLDTGKESWVFVLRPDGHFDPRLVAIKFHAAEWVAIESGLKEGEKIVTSANFLIDSESRLRGAALGASAPSCPEGQAWDAGMSMCMPKAAKNSDR